MIIRHERLHVPIQRAFVEDNHVAQTLAPEGTDQAFDVRALPRRSRGRKDFLNAHILDLLREFIAEDPIAIPQQITRRGIPRKCVAELLGSPLRGGVGGYAEMHDPPAVVSQNQEHIQDLKPDRRHCEEVDGHQGLDVILKEGPPGLRRRLPLPDHVLGDAGLSDVDAEFEQFAVDAGRSR